MSDPSSQESTFRLRSPFRGSLSEIPFPTLHGAASSAEGAVNDEVAAAAGQRTWAAWAGRDSPTNSGEWKRGDAFRGLYRFGAQRLPAMRNSVQQDCPVCFNVLDGKDRFKLWCGCTTCTACMTSWAYSQVGDAGNHTDMLLVCPVCRAVVGKQDARRIMALDRQLYREHSAKLLQRTLAANRTYFACTGCTGGGFTDAACLGVRQAQRDETASWFFMCARTFGLGCWVAAIKLRSSTLKWLILGLLEIVLPRALQHFSWQLHCEPFDVECPECSAKFKLSSDSSADGASDEWIQNNCRPCPRCNTPIVKNGGCNHMRCAQCRVQFCWACMKVGLRCGAYRCSNGAPTGNAVIMGNFRAQIDGMLLFYGLAGCAFGVATLSAIRHVCSMLMFKVWQVLGR